MSPLLLTITSPFSIELISNAQQENRFARIPLWIWVLVIFLGVVVVGIIVALKEEEEEKAAEMGTRIPSVPPTPEPVTAAATVEPDTPFSGVEAPVVEEVKPVAEPAPKPQPDNLKRVSGIGPKIENLLKDKGITTFKQLAETEVSRLEALLEEAGWENIANPASWPEEARRLAED